MVVDLFMDYDVSHYHSFFVGYCSAFNPFGKVVPQHGNILIPTFSPMERSTQVDRHSLVERYMSGLLYFTMPSYSGLAASASCASLTPRPDVFLHSWPVETSFYQDSSSWRDGGMSW